MTVDLSGSVSILFRQIRAGDALAVGRLRDRFRSRLTALGEVALPQAIHNVGGVPLLVRFEASSAARHWHVQRL